MRIASDAAVVSETEVIAVVRMNVVKLSWTKTTCVYFFPIRSAGLLVKLIRSALQTSSG